MQGVKIEKLLQLLGDAPVLRPLQTVEEKMTVMAKWRVAMAEVAIQNGEPPFPPSPENPEPGTEGMHV